MESYVPQVLAFMKALVLDTIVSVWGTSEPTKRHSPSRYDFSIFKWGVFNMVALASYPLQLQQSWLFIMIGCEDCTELNHLLFHFFLISNPPHERPK